MYIQYETYALNIGGRHTVYYIPYIISIYGNICQATRSDMFHYHTNNDESTMCILYLSIKASY